MDLHYSQTKYVKNSLGQLFHYLMDLHYSQTICTLISSLSKFHYLMDLHYSQTCVLLNLCGSKVSLPYGFTLFSNPEK